MGKGHVGWDCGVEHMEEGLVVGLSKGGQCGLWGWCFWGMCL